MIELLTYRTADALEIIKGQAKQPGITADQTADKLAQLETSDGPKCTFAADGKVIGVAGLTICWPEMAEAWCLFVENISDYKMLPRLAKRTLRSWADEYNLVRIQAPLRADFMDGIRFAEWLGFECEGRLRKFHPDGCDALMHSIIFER